MVTLTEFGELDVLLSLGVVPVAHGLSGAWERGLAPWQSGFGLEDSTELSMADGPQLELLAAQTPDLIVGMDWSAEEVYDDLAEIAPTVTISESTPWREAITTVGRAAWRDDEAADAVAAGEAALADAAEQLKPLAGIEIVVASAFGDTVYAQGATSLVTTLLTELGLTPRPIGDEGLTQWSYEQVDLVGDAGILLSLATDPESTIALQGSALFGSIPALAQGHYEALDADLSTFVAGVFTPVSAAWGLPLFVEALLRCQAGQGRPLT